MNFKSWPSVRIFFVHMSIKDYLSYSLGRKDQGPNKRLAQKISESNDMDKIEELITIFDSKPPIEVQKDCSLTLAWIAESSPEMVVPHVDYFLGKLNHPINRVIWGSMMSLTAIAPFVQDKLFERLTVILDAMDTGTVVTRDHGYRILVILYQNKKYRQDVFLLVLEQLSKAPSNQLGQYTERLIEVMDSGHKAAALISILENRFEDIGNPYHRKRLEKNLKKLNTL